MSEFQAYFVLGLKHITDINAYDHMLFVCTLCALYYWKSWKNILILVTAFTLGHSITLSLSALNILSFDTKIIEILIPFTIMITALSNLFFDEKKSNYRVGYFLTTFFGLIHGMGFSNYLKSLLTENNNIISPLLAFNIGIEIGQIIIIIVFLSLYASLETLFKFTPKSWKIFWSGLGFGIALLLFLEQFFS